jgi:hypothetical protein
MFCFLTFYCTGYIQYSLSTKINSLYNTDSKIADCLHCYTHVSCKVERELKDEDILPRVQYSNLNYETNANTTTLFIKSVFYTWQLSTGTGTCSVCVPNGRNYRYLQ